MLSLPSISLKHMNLRIIMLNVDLFPVYHRGGGGGGLPDGGSGGVNPGVGADDL